MLNSVKVKEQLTVDDIIRLCCHLQGSEEYYYDNQGNPMFSTSLDHEGGDSFKLYYFPVTKLFHCFTGTAESYDVFELVSRALGVDFKEAFQYIVKFFKIKGKYEEEPERQLTDDWDIFQQIEDYEKISHEDFSINPIQPNLLEYFYPLAAPVEWQKDGISSEVMRYYNIRIDAALQKIIIPHHDIEGNLIGIRGRSYDPIDLSEGKKYMPVYIEGDLYRHPLGKNLFGLYQNKETIKRLKKVLICESEKSVMQAASMYGIDNCFVVATCGSSLSQAQIELISQLGVEEVILGYDKEFQGKRGENDEVLYEQKLLKLVQPLTQYFNVYLLMDFEGLLGYKDSPTDRGKDVLEKLMKNKIYVPPISQEIPKRGR